MYLIVINGHHTGINYKYAELIQSILNDNNLKSDIVSCLSDDINHIGVNEYEKFIFVMPEWNGSYPGQVKVFIDNQSHPNKFQGKKVSLIGLSGGHSGNIIGIHHLRDVLEYVGSNVSSLKTYIPSDKLNLTNSDYIARLTEHVNKFIQF